MPDKPASNNNDKPQPSTFKADDFDKEKDAADKEQNQPTASNKPSDDEVLKEQKETD